MNYFQSTKKESGVPQPTITVFWTNSDPTQRQEGFSVNVDVTQHDYIRVKYNNYYNEPISGYETIIPVSSLDPNNIITFHSGICRCITSSAALSYIRFILKGNQSLTITSIYKNGALGSANDNGNLIITELAFIDDVTL